MAALTTSWMPSAGRIPSAIGGGREDERELADLGEAGRDREAHARLLAEHRHDRERGERLRDDDDEDDRRRSAGMFATRNAGSNSIPTETKKRTEKTSRSGSASAATWWLVSDSLTTAPARNAPRASETPKTANET